VSSCGWCEGEIKGEPVLPYEKSLIVVSRDGSAFEVLPAISVGFCSDGCAWAFFAEVHRLWGLEGKELRSHLVNVEGLPFPPGKPAGEMGKECRQRLASIRNALAEFDCCG
jgi:hypothetical protein